MLIIHDFMFVILFANSKIVSYIQNMCHNIPIFEKIAINMATFTLHSQCDLSDMQSCEYFNTATYLLTGTSSYHRAWWMKMSQFLRLLGSISKMP